jgi:hypothetical protein
MTPNSTKSSVTTITLLAYLLAVIALAALAIMTKRLDHYFAAFAERGIALPPVTALLFEIPRYAYMLLIASLVAALALNQFYNRSSSGKLVGSLVLATLTSLVALIMWTGLWLPLITLNRLS